MKTSYLFELNPHHNETERKPRNSFEERKSRQNNREGHMNPLKLKTSFLRQSLNFNSNQPQLSLNIQSPSTIHREQSFSLNNSHLYSDKKEGFPMKKIGEKFDGNIPVQNIQRQQIAKIPMENHKERQIIRLSGRRHDLISGINHQQKSQEIQKQNDLQNSSCYRSSVNMTQRDEMQKMLLNQRKGSLPSTQVFDQQTILDNSLADYTEGLKFFQFSKQSNLSVINEQLQLILKRVAKNQCDIQALKRNKTVQTHLEGVWKHLSINQNHCEINEKKISKCNEQLESLTQTLSNLKNSIQTLNFEKSHYLSEFRSIGNRIQELQNIKDSQKIVSNSQLSQLQKSLQEKLSQLENKLKVKWQSQIEQVLRRITERQNSIKTQNLNQKQFIGQNKGFEVSKKKSHESIELIYKEILKVGKKCQSQSLTPSSSIQNLYFQSDRSKLLANVFNNPSRKLSYSGSFSTQQANSSCANNEKQIVVTQVQYFIDQEGYLLDQSQFYITNDLGQQIKIDQGMIEFLKRQNILKI